MALNLKRFLLFCPRPIAVDEDPPPFLVGWCLFYNLKFSLPIVIQIEVGVLLHIDLYPVMPYFFGDLSYEEN